MAPMFLVSNTRMIIAASNAGIAGAIPALNYRTDTEFRAALKELKDILQGRSFGINLICNQSNIKLSEQLKACVEYEVPFIITSLGSPQIVIDACHPKGMKVFCDVIDLTFAHKVAAMGADALIAVNNEAGGHAGDMSPESLIPLLARETKLPIISAGGVGNRTGLDRMLALGAAGVSVGSPFIASTEAPVSNEYKQAIVHYGAKDIVRTTKISGTPCTVINTPYVKETGLTQNWIERALAKNKWLKKWVKMLTFYKGMKQLERAAFGATYQTYWCAGQSIEYVDAIRPVSEIVKGIVE